MASTSRMPPPLRIHSSRFLSDTEAVERLSEFLSAAKDNPHLHPDAILTTSGVQFSTQGATGGVVLHNLRRLEAGLRGEVLFPEPDGDELGAPAKDGKSQDLNRRKHDKEEDADVDVDAEQLEAEGHPREMGDVDHKGSAEVEHADPDEAEGSRQQRMDKEARKKQKKERRKAEKGESKEDRRKRKEEKKKRREKRNKVQPEES